MKNSIKKLTYISLIAALFGLNSCSKDDDSDDVVTPVIPPVTTNFCYNFNKTDVSYDSIQGGTFINNLNNDGFYEVDLGFSFNLCDQNFSKLYILEDTYSTTFTYKVSPGNIDLRKYYTLANGDLDFEPKYDSSYTYIVTRLVKKTTGSAGNKVTTIEFRDLGYIDYFNSVDYTVNYKIVFKESDNSVSYHYGPNDLTIDFKQDVFNQFAVGLYSNQETDGLFLKGDPNSPTTIKNGYNSELDTWPLESTMYKFTKK